MHDATIEQLLHEEESSSLDFKRDQYIVQGGTADQKSELVKDILAFANAWRRQTAYILIGVEEVRGGRSIPVGVASHLNDHDLQQLVNSKTNRPVTFAYYAYPFHDVQLGVIEIPVQKRPLYPKNNFGRLAAGSVYIRRGSSTATADPDEIAQMGAADSGANGDVPTFELEWADISRQETLGQELAARPVVLLPKLGARELMPKPSRYGLQVATFGTPGEKYYSGLIDYQFDRLSLIPVGLRIKNTSRVGAADVEVKCQLPRLEGVRVLDYSGQPYRPSPHAYMDVFRNITPMATQLRKDPDPNVRDFETHWDITIPYGDVRPQATVWSSDVLYVSAEVPMRVVFPFEVFAANLPQPQMIELAIEIEPERRPMTPDDVPAEEE